ncbi:unnamed protein product, partial [Meganyctiphanes norvegica]
MCFCRKKAKKHKSPASDALQTLGFRKERSDNYDENDVDSSLMLTKHALTSSWPSGAAKVSSVVVAAVVQEGRQGTACGASTCTPNYFLLVFRCPKMGEMEQIKRCSYLVRKVTTSKYQYCYINEINDFCINFISCDRTIRLGKFEGIERSKMKLAISSDNDRKIHLAIFFKLYDGFVQNLEESSSSLEIMKSLQKPLMTALPAPRHIKHYLDGAKVMVLCELSKGDEAYALLRICHVDLPVTIKRTVTYSFIRFCGNHTLNDNESPWTKVQNWELENPSCILTLHQKGVKEFLESTWLEFHIDSKHLEKVLSIFTSLCSEMQKYSYFFKKLTIMVIEFFHDIGQANMAFCVLDEVRRLQARDAEIFTNLIPLIFEPKICMNLLTELLFACEVIVELGVVLSKHDIEELIKFFSSVDKIDVSLKLALLGIKTSIYVNITIIEIVVRKFDCMTHSLGKLYELVKSLNYADLRFLKKSLNRVLKPRGISRTYLNFHQNKVICNIQEYFRNHGIILQGAEFPNLSSKKEFHNKELYSLSLKCPGDDAQQTKMERKCYKSPTKGTCKQVTIAEDMNKVSKNDPAFSRMQSLASQEMDRRIDNSVIKEDTLSKSQNKMLEKIERNCAHSTINSNVNCQILSKCASSPVEDIFTTYSETNKEEISSSQYPFTNIGRKEILKQGSIYGHLNKGDILKNYTPSSLSNSAQKLAVITNTISFGFDENCVSKHLVTKSPVSNSHDDESGEENIFQSENSFVKPDLQEKNDFQEQHAFSPGKSILLDNFNQRCQGEKDPTEAIPLQISKHTAEETHGHEQLSSPTGNSSLVDYSKQCLVTSTSSQSLPSKNVGMQRLQNEIFDIKENFSSPFGKRKVMKRSHSIFEGIKQQNFLSENQLEGLSVTFEVPKNESIHSKKSVFFNKRDEQMTRHQSISNENSNSMTTHQSISNENPMSADKIALKALEILNKNRLLRNIKKPFTSSEIMKNSQNKKQDATEKSTDVVTEESKEKQLSLTSDTESQVFEKISFKDPRLSGKNSLEENERKENSESDCEILKNKPYNQEENQTPNSQTLKEIFNKSIEDMNDLSNVTYVSPARSTPPLEIDEELETLASEKIIKNEETNIEEEKEKNLICFG